MHHRGSSRRGFAIAAGIDTLEDRRLFAGAAFAQPMALTTGVNPMAVASADVDNDGYQYLLVASSSSISPRFYVHLGNGTGGLRVATTSKPQGIVAGDFDHDVAVAVAGTALLGLTGSVEIFRGDRPVNGRRAR